MHSLPVQCLFPTQEGQQPTLSPLIPTRPLQLEWLALRSLPTGLHRTRFMPAHPFHSAAPPWSDPQCLPKPWPQPSTGLPVQPPPRPNTSTQHKSQRLRCLRYPRLSCSMFIWGKVRVMSLDLTFKVPDV